MEDQLRGEFGAQRVSQSLDCVVVLIASFLATNSHIVDLFVLFYEYCLNYHKDEVLDFFYHLLLFSQILCLKFIPISLQVALLILDPLSKTLA